jgi:acyl-homoserine lactone acylase PvdQ
MVKRNNTIKDLQQWFFEIHIESEKDEGCQSKLKNVRQKNRNKMRVGNMKKYAKFMVLLFLGFELVAQNSNRKYQVEIKRDNWGIPHIYGGTDAEAVFGLMYAQCEDDFDRVELNYIEKLGKLSEINGEKDLYNDLLTRILIKEKEAKSDYNQAPIWLKKLLFAHADAYNYFLKTHPEIKPKIIKKFEPWYALLWTDGSIGAISTAELGTEDLKAFYNPNSNKVGVKNKKDTDDYHQTGSNGFAIAPQRSETGNAMLYINPHTTFFFRPEVHVKSNEGLNAYGAVTWGQFFVYQGFNENCGWMHTSSNADVADVYKEKITKEKGKWLYEYEGKKIPLGIEEIKIKYLDNGTLKTKIFETYYTKNGPIMGKDGNYWLSLRSYNRSMQSLIQSWLRTKAKGLDDYKKVMDLKSNTSNNTVFADKYGNIAYWHGNYMPIRNPELNWSKPQEGWKKENAYSGLHEVEETVHIYNPTNGWLQNCNSTPFTAAGLKSPKKSDYRTYMAPDGENFRGVRANQLLSEIDKIGLDELIRLGNDRKLAAFDVLIPGLVNKYKKSESKDINEMVDSLRTWNRMADSNSIATTIAIEWAQSLSSGMRKVYVYGAEDDQVKFTENYIKTVGVEDLVIGLNTTKEKLENQFGTWKVKWGDLNRFQRISGNINNTHDDNQPSYAVPFASALWGSLPSFNSRTYSNTKKRYGFSGNSFVCAVEFGAKIKAKSILAGGNNGDPKSKYFNNQGKMYAEGKFKDVLFYDEDIDKNTVNVYKIKN